MVTISKTKGQHFPGADRGEGNESLQRMLDWPGTVGIRGWPTGCPGWPTATDITVATEWAGFLLNSVDYVADVCVGFLLQGIKTFHDRHVLGCWLSIELGAGQCVCSPSHRPAASEQFVLILSDRLEEHQ
jgi:hypothetical protein